MNVTAVQTATGLLSSRSFAVSTTGSAGLTWGVSDSYQASGTSSNSFSNNSYSHLAAMASVSETLRGLSTTSNQVALSLAIMAGSDRQDEKRDALIQSVVDTLDAGETERARDIAQGMLKENGQDAAAAHLIARSYLDEQNYDEAEKYFARASLLAPSSRRFSSDLENVRLLTKDDDEVIEAAARMIRQPDRRVQGIRALAYLVERSPDNAQAHQMLGDALMAGGYAGAAVSSYRNALVAADETDLDRLITRFRELVEAVPDAGVTHSLLGQALQRQGNYQEAFTELKLAASLAPENASYQLALGLLYGDMGFEALDERRPTDAMRYFEEAAALDPTSETIKSGLARAHLDMSTWWLARGLEAKAFAELNSAMLHAPDADEELNQDLAGQFNVLGNRHNGDGELEWAISSYKRAHELVPDEFSYRNKLAVAYDARGTELFDAGQYEQAETYYQNAVDLFPGGQTYLAHLQAAQDAQSES